MNFSFYFSSGKVLQNLFTLVRIQPGECPQPSTRMDGRTDRWTDATKRIIMFRCEMPTVLICPGSVRTPQKGMRVKLKVHLWAIWEVNLGTFSSGKVIIISRPGL